MRRYPASKIRDGYFLESTDRKSGLPGLRVEWIEGVVDVLLSTPSCSIRDYESFRSRKNWSASGDLERDLPVVQSSMAGLLQTVARHGPTSLASEAQALLVAEPEVIAQTLLNYWRSPSDTQFFAKAILQPYAHWLAETRAAPVGRELTGHIFTLFSQKCNIQNLDTKKTNIESTLSPTNFVFGEIFPRTKTTFPGS